MFGDLAVNRKKDASIKLIVLVCSSSGNAVSNTAQLLRNNPAYSDD
jgi:hypothetical protein